MTTVPAVRPYRELLPNGEMRHNMHYGQIAVMMSKAREILALSGVQSGKALAIDTPIPTPNGFVSMESLHPGDVVFDDGGRECQVIFATEIQYGRRCFRVEFDDGAWLIADADHCWKTQTATQRKNETRQVKIPVPGWAYLQKRRHPRSSVVTTNGIRRTLISREGALNESTNHSIALCQPVTYRAKDYPIQPYTLGCWLGDGTSASSNITTMDEEVLAGITIEGYSLHARPSPNTGKAQTYQVGGGHPSGSLASRANTLQGRLRTLGVLNNKHIPDSYLRGSYDQRMALLRGLMDTDGYCAPNGRCEWSSVKPLLAYGFGVLLSSLGIKWRSRIKTPLCNGIPSKDTTVFDFCTTLPVFTIARKLVRQAKVNRPDVRRRFITAVVPIASMPVKCIQVSSPSSMYLAGYGYVPTHNTSVGVDWMDREIAERGEGDYLMVSATYPLMQLKLLPEFLDVFQHMQHKGRYRDSDKVFEFTVGKTRVIFGTATNPESLESATAKAAVADEAGQRQFRREAREALLRRLSIHQGRILYPTTPYLLGWLKTELFDRAKEPDSGIEVISWPSTANPAFPPEEFERAKKTMPGWKFRMFYEGKFERPAGLVYDAFDEAACKIKRFAIPAAWPHYVGHDFGTANPAAMFYAQDPATGYFYAYDEYKPGPGRSTREHVQEFKRLTEGLNVMKRAGGSHQEEEIREAYRANGWFIQEPKIHDVATGIDRVYGLHKLNKLFVFNDLQKYLDEKLSYSYALNDKYEPTDDIEDKSTFHLLDAERYILSDFTPELVDGDNQRFVMQRHGGYARRIIRAGGQRSRVVTRR